jgi:hypothetical protein
MDILIYNNNNNNNNNNNSLYCNNLKTLKILFFIIIITTKKTQMSFPLYDILLKDCTSNQLIKIDLTIEQKKELISMIALIDEKGHQNIFTIIRIHGLKTNSGEIFDVPYDGQKNVHDIKFNLDKLPLIVKHMIYQFVKIHIHEMKYEFERREVEKI